MFKKYHPALDHILAGLGNLHAGKPVRAAQHFGKALANQKDFQEVVALLDNANTLDKATAAKKTTIAEALTVIAAKAKAKKAKKDFGKKKKAKADADEVEMTEDDLLDDGADAVEAEGEGEEDIDLDALDLDDGDEGDDVLAEGEGDDDLDLEALDDGDEDVTEMPEASPATAAEDGTGVGTMDEVKPGKDGTPPANDQGEPSTDVTKTAVKARARAQAQAVASKKARTDEARRILANIAILEEQSAKAGVAAQTKAIRK